MVLEAFRRGARALLAALLLAGGVDAAAAQATAPLPPGNITLLVPFAAGGPIDVVARLFSDKVGTRHGRTIVVENRAGAAGNVGAGALTRAAPNGLTWMLSVDSLWTVNPHLGAAPSFDVDKDIEPVGQLGQVILMLAINPKVPATSWAELRALSASRSLNFGSAGIGSPGHLALEYLKMVAPFDAVHVPLRGAAPALTDLIAGNIDGAFIVAGVMLDHVRSGSVRALAVSDTRRMAKFPDVPTAEEAGIAGFAARFTNILAVPAGTSGEVRAFLAGELEAFLALADVQARLDAIGTLPVGSTAAETRAWISQERARWGKVIKARGL